MLIVYEGHIELSSKIDRHQYGYLKVDEQNSQSMKCESDCGNNEEIDSKLDDGQQKIVAENNMEQDEEESDQEVNNRK